MTSNHHTEVANGANVDASVVNAPDGQLDSAITNLLAGALAFAQINFGGVTALTISSGAVTATKTYHSVDTEGSAASDDLTDINGGAEGDLIIIRSVNAARVVTVKHDAAKIYLAGEADFDLDSPNKLLALLHDGSKWCHLQVSRTTGGSGQSYAKLSDVKAANTSGGDPSGTATFVTRDLNTEDNDTDSIVSLSSNQFTLAAGTYRISASFPAVDCGQVKGRLRNITDGATEIIGTTEYTIATDFVQIRCFISGEFTIAASKTFEIQAYYQTSAGSGWTEGQAANAGEDEVYTVVELWKVA